MDADSFAQEYLCQFVDESTAFIPYDTIRGCIRINQTLVVEEVFWALTSQGERDLTVLIVLTEIEGKVTTPRDLSE